MIAEFKERRTLKRRNYVRHKFKQKYTKGDIELLAEVDNANECLAGPATIKLMNEDYDNFGKTKFVRLKDISVSHLYRLRTTDRYKLRQTDTNLELKPLPKLIQLK